MKQSIIDFFTANCKEIEEIGIAISIVMTATGIKFWKAIQDGLKPTFKWFVGESFMSAIVGVTGYYVFDKLLHLDKVLVCILCVWLGSASAIFSKKVEDFVGFLFERLKAIVSAKTPLIILVFLLFSITISCGRKPMQSTHTIERIIERQKDSIVNKEISKAIIDSLFVKIGQVKTAKPDCDSIANAEIQKLLRQIATLKKSGNNELGFYYDERNKMLVAYGKLDQSIKELRKLTETNNTNTNDKEKTEIPVQYIPTWVKWLAVFGCISLLVFLVQLSKKFAV